MPVTIFHSGDAGTNKTGYAGLKGAGGDLVKVLNSTLVLDTGTTQTGAGPTYADATNAWVQMGAGTALFVANNANTDFAYFGGRQKFAQLIMQFATLGIGGTCTYEYWNGSAWVALVSPTDGTSQLTAAGTLSWAIAGQTGWAQVAVNSVTLYWIRIKWGSTYSTNPVLKLGSIYGWGSPYQGTNGATYRSMLTSGVQHYVTVNDNGPNGTSTTKEAWAYAAEGLTQYNTDQFASGTNGVTMPFPSMTQGVSGTTGHVVWRKSADTVTARSWKVLNDEKTFVFEIITGDATTNYVGGGFGEFYSLVNGDLYRSFIAGRLTENSATITGSSGLNPFGNRVGGLSASFVTTGSSIYIARAYTGVGSSLLAGLLGGMPSAMGCGSGSGSVYSVGGIGLIAFPNPPDGGAFIGSIFITDGATGIRGRLRGLWDWGHPSAALNDGDQFSGTGALASKTFEVVRTVAFIDTANNQTQNSGVLVFETSNTWESN